MTKKLLVFSLALSLVLASSLPSFSQDKVEGKIQAIDKAANKITINGNEYSLSSKAAQVEVKVGDMVQAIVKGETVIKLGVLK